MVVLPDDNVSRRIKNRTKAATLLDELFVWALACGRCDMEWDTVDEKEEP